MKKWMTVLLVSVLFFSLGEAKIIREYKGSGYLVYSHLPNDISTLTKFSLIKIMLAEDDVIFNCYFEADFKEESFDEHIKVAYFYVINGDSTEVIIVQMMMGKNTRAGKPWGTSQVHSDKLDRILSAKKVKVMVVFEIHSPVKFVLSKSLLKEWKIVSEAQFIKKTE